MIDSMITSVKEFVSAIADKEDVNSLYNFNFTYELSPKTHEYNGVVIRFASNVRIDTYEGVVYLSGVSGVERFLLTFYQMSILDDYFYSQFLYGKAELKKQDEEESKSEDVVEGNGEEAQE